MKKIKFIDIFCGAGGLSYSFKKRNHDLKLAADIDPISIRTLKTNFSRSSKYLINEDIVKLIKLRKFDIFKNKIDLLMGGPPCQGFSAANRQNILNDPRNELYNYFLEFAKKINPKFILIENVIGIKTRANDILTKLNEIGYQADFRILQAHDFGVPQNRRRVFFFAIKKNQNRNLIENFFDTLENFKKKSKKFLLKDA